MIYGQVGVLQDCLRIDLLIVKDEHLIVKHDENQIMMKISETSEVIERKGILGKYIMLKSSRNQIFMKRYFINPADYEIFKLTINQYTQKKDPA